MLPAAIVDRFVQLTWRESRNTPVGSYRIEVGTQPGAADLLTADVGPVTAFAGQAPPREYFAWVVATNPCGASARSNVIRLEVAAGPPAPANLRAVVDGTRVTVTWEAVADVDGYALEAGTASGLADIGTIATGGTGYVANGVAAGTYYVRVRSVRAGVRSGPSGEIVIVVP
jgi:hypothetical protein